ncbi:MAG: CoB--CoM heterodisulfide reductase iron-sulfur subunit B family protein [Candidatus Hodarchaeota archaeon]
MTKTYALFLGCYIPALQPFAEASLRKIAPSLKLKFMEMEGATCCPVPEIVRLADHDAWLYVSARNLALAEALGNDIMVVCNGCWETLHETREVLLKDNEKLAEVNSKLKLLDREYTGKSEVKHFLEVVIEEVGLQALQAAVKERFTELTVAVQYGCKLYKSPNEKFVSYFDNILKALGVKVAEYGAEKICCGFPLSLYSLDKATEERSRFKLEKMQAAKVDCIVTACPGCYDVLENAQLLLRRKGVRFDIPMLNLMELMALSFGFKPEDIGFDRHRIKTDTLIAKIRPGGN